MFEGVCLSVCLFFFLGERSHPDTSHMSSPKLLLLSLEDQARPELTVHTQLITTQQLGFTNYEGQTFQTHTWALRPLLWCISAYIASMKNNISKLPLSESIFGHNAAKRWKPCPHFFNSQCSMNDWMLLDEMTPLYSFLFHWFAQVQKLILRIWMLHVR